MVLWQRKGRTLVVPEGLQQACITTTYQGRSEASLKAAYLPPTSVIEAPTPANTLHVDEAKGSYVCFE